MTQKLRTTTKQRAMVTMAKIVETMMMPEGQGVKVALNEGTT
jgi:hypothetical protein